jgi:hypothetical protein
MQAAQHLGRSGGGGAGSDDIGKGGSVFDQGRKAPCQTLNVVVRDAILAFTSLTARM